MSETLQRTIPGTSTPFLMDDFTYDYTSGNNQLENVNDAVTTTSTMGLGDIQNGQDNVLATGGSNYQYDDIGQLLKDKQEKIVSIDWKVTNKVEQINFDMNGDLTIDKTIHFDYDAMGNRIAKHVTENAETTSTFYTLDAQEEKTTVFEERGSIRQIEQPNDVMSIYGVTMIDSESTLLLKERNIYGSSRLGLEEVNLAMPFRTLNQTVTLEDYYIAQNYTGDKRYELANHLGNVLEVITDRKLPVEETFTFISLDGTNDHLATSTFNPSLGTELTLQAWVRTTDTGSNRAILSHYDASPDAGALLSMNSSGKITLDGRNGTGVYRSSGNKQYFGK